MLTSLLDTLHAHQPTSPNYSAPYLLAYLHYQLLLSYLLVYLLTSLLAPKHALCDAS